MTVLHQRLSATHLPEIIEQIHERKEQFALEIIRNVHLEYSNNIHINETCERVYQLGPSSIPNWPIEILCDSQIWNYRRRIILSSIVKIFNRTNLPLILFDVDSIETNDNRRILHRIKSNEEYSLPINVLYTRSTSRVFFAVDDEGGEEEAMTDFLSFDWANETTVDRIFKRKTNEQIHLVVRISLLVCQFSMFVFSNLDPQRINRSLCREYR